MLKFRANVLRMQRIIKESIVVFKWAFFFKIVMVILQVIANILIPDHQGSMDDVVMRMHRHPDHDVITETLLGGFDNWDSEYYLYIAQHGYTFLQSMAFFPLYPMLIWLVGRVALFPLSFLLADRSLFLIAGSLVNLCVFPLAAVALYLLTLFITNNQGFSIMTIVLFCVNPASVFMSTVYTETIYAFCTFSGLCLLTLHYSWSASLLFSLASATRSNGIILVGFIAFYHLHQIYMFLHVSKSNLPSVILKTLFFCALQCVVVVFLFILFQGYSYWKYCSIPASSDEKVYEWCHWTLPMSYPYIQEHYWNVGFLRYFELKQIPNFLLALPVVCLSFCTLYGYISEGEERLRVFQKEYRGAMLAYTVHLLFLVGYGILNMHIQVLTRLLFSSSPVLYWSTAMVISDAVSLPHSSPPSSYPVSLLLRKLTTVFHSKSRLAKLIILYFLTFVILGFLLHCNFFPWT